MQMVVSKEMYGRGESLFQTESASERSLFESRSGTRYRDGGRSGCEEEEGAWRRQTSSAHIWWAAHLDIALPIYRLVIAKLKTNLHYFKSPTVQHSTLAGIETKYITPIYSKFYQRLSSSLQSSPAGKI